MAPALSAAAFEELYRDTVRDLLRYARRRTTHDPDGLVAETFVVAWRRRETLPTGTLQRAWLFGIARTLLAEDHRLRAREAGTAADLRQAAGTTLAGGTTPDDEPTPEAAAVDRAVHRLPPLEREALLLVHWEGLTPAELATALGVRPGTARVRLHRARRALAADPELQALLDLPVEAPRRARGDQPSLRRLT